MKKSICITLIILIFSVFCIFELKRQSGFIVKGVITPSILQVDLNHNGTIEDDEVVCIPDMQTFSADLQKPQENASKLGLNNKEALSIGYLTQKFVQDMLLEQKVKLKFEKNKSSECKYAQLYLKNENIREILDKNGYTIKDFKPVNPVKFQNLLEQARKTNLVIYNHKSGKFHDITCKYGLAAGDAVLIPKKDLPKDATACAFCHARDNDKIKEEQVPLPEIISSSDIKMYFTDFTKKLKPDNSCSSNVCKAFLKEINNASESIDIALYGWTNNQTLNDAVRSAIKRGVNVRLVYDTDTKPEKYYPDTEFLAKLIKNSRSDAIEGDKKQTNYLMHNKFAIFDGKTVLTGSMNFSSTGLSGYNANTVIIINSLPVAKLYETEFNQMYSGKFHNLKSARGIPQRIAVGDSYVTVYFSPQDKGITKGVIPIINNAQKYIYIPTFLITHREMTDALIRAKQRGVDVKIIIDATNARSNSSTHELLRKNGIPVKTENYAGKMHLKSLICDDKYVVAGSMNFSFSGENRNDENMIIIENFKLTRFYKNYFNNLWNRIPDIWLKYNVSAESHNSLGSCSDGIDNDYDGKIDNADEGCQKLNR